MSECGVTPVDLFFFSSRRRHTRFDCDWSSDVCSSDLAAPGLHRGFRGPVDSRQRHRPPTSNSSCAGGGRGERRSGERRGGEEGRSRWAPYHLKKKRKSTEKRGRDAGRTTNEVRNSETR